MKNIITCPHCGAEYMPAEIYMPNNFFGRPDMIYRDDNNKILSFDGSSPDLLETYRCDFCDKKFNVKATLKFDTSSDTEYFKDDYKIKLSKPSLFLDEE